MSAQVVSAEQVADLVREHERIVPMGGGTKPALLGDGTRLDLTGCCGITEYQASEYTFTARAGTRLAEVAQELKSKGQYLPCDPPLVKAGATLGGTVAAGLCGAGRFRYGGLRDFLIGVQFVDGAGRLVRSGGKVVKNAAGFDLPKFLVGSLGRFGILTELSFKVFPLPADTLTLLVPCSSPEEATERLAEVARSRWEADALDYDSDRQSLVIRLAGPTEALDQLAREISSRWAEVSRLSSEMEELEWAAAAEFSWVREGECLIKAPIAPSQIPVLERQLQPLKAVRVRYSSGGAVAWIAIKDERRDIVSEILQLAGLTGLVVWGENRLGCWSGKRREDAITTAVKKALDPDERFAPF